MQGSGGTSTVVGGGQVIGHSRSRVYLERRVEDYARKKLLFSYSKIYGPLKHSRFNIGFSRNKNMQLNPKILLNIGSIKWVCLV